MQLRSGYASLTVRARSILQALIALTVTFILVGSTLAMDVDERAAHLSHAAEHTDWPFKHVVIDAAPLATFRINDLQIGDINGDGLPDIWTSGRGAGANAYQMVWYKNPNWERYEIAPGDFATGLRHEIADGLGFSDQSHFIRQFKELTGVTPGQYRRERRFTS